MGEVEVQLSLHVADNFPVKEEQQLTQCSDQLPSGPRHQGGDRGGEQSASEPQAPSATTSFNLTDARWMSRFRDFSLEFGQ